MAAFELRRLDIFWEINLKETVGIYYNNLDCKMLTKLNAVTHNSRHGLAVITIPKQL
jgi:hypothetical protein